MSVRQIILDTETTGIKVEEGHRIIEIGALEMINRRLTGKHFHTYINPAREVEAGALAVHGISNEFLLDKPSFAQIVDELMHFISDAELIIHNAPFDISFLNRELFLLRSKWKVVTHYCQVVDTLVMARQMHVGQRNSLDALCKRYNVDNTKREYHGALLDAHLLAQVYLAMTGGQGSFFDVLEASPAHQTHARSRQRVMRIEQDDLPVLRASEQELAEHMNYLARLKNKQNV